MSDSELAIELQKRANIDKLMKAHAIIKKRQAIERARDILEQKQELNFNDDNFDGDK